MINCGGMKLQKVARYQVEPAFSAPVDRGAPNASWRDQNVQTVTGKRSVYFGESNPNIKNQRAEHESVIILQWLCSTPL